ncbi:MAG: hypothetical protein OQK75_03670 [Gammaproteobacteria bacterium]|nr:hypothetical protein [Gammaproteobacteria bacterium]MCW8986747.1 hypothetical protein [Gammaproteobacteria bacterium]MCW9029879.1 hypothetical protein [Gammaproteobacteria bacterium]
MLPNKFELPLALVVKDSKIIYAYLILIFLFSMVGIFISSLMLLLQLLLVVLLIVMTVLIFKIQRVNKITRLKLSRDDKWQIETDNRQHFDAELQGECIVTYFLVWLNFTTCNSFGRKKVFHVLLLPDSVDADLFRQLRVRLRFLKKTSAEDELQAPESL